MTENKVFIAEQETLLEVKEQTEKLIRNLIPTDAPIYGMVIHEASDLNPATRVEYLGANKDFKPMSMNMATHAMDYGSWADWSWLKANVPVMCGWDGEIKYYLNPDDYTKKADGTASDVSNANFAGNAMAVIKKSTKRNIRSVQIVMYTSASGRLIRISSRLVLMSKEKLGTTCSFPCSMALLMETEG